jgi:hypothetical protein
MMLNFKGFGLAHLLGKLPKNASSHVLPLTNSERELTLLNQNDNKNVLNPLFKILSKE